MSAVAPLRDAAFDSLYRENRNQVFSYTLAQLRNVDDAEDATQTTFLNAFRAIESGHHPEVAEAWLIGIARNVCRQGFRDAQRRPRVGPLDVERLETSAPEPRVSAAEIRNALINLPSRQRTALVMRELEGRSHTEICQALGLSESALQALLASARRTARELLDGRMTCKEARRAIKRQYDDLVSLPERRRLMSHLRECASCAAVAGNRPPAGKGALRTLLGVVPLPSWLPSIFGGSGGASAGSSAGAAGAVAGKLLLIAATGTTVAGVTWGVHAIGTNASSNTEPAPPSVYHARPAANVVSPRPRLHATPTFVPRATAAPAPNHKARAVHRKPAPASVASTGSSPSTPLASLTQNTTPPVSTPAPADPPADPSPVSPDTTPPANGQADPATPPADGGGNAVQIPDGDQSGTGSDVGPADAPTQPVAAAQPDGSPPADTTTTTATPPSVVSTGSTDSQGNQGQGRAVGPNGTPPGQAKSHGLNMTGQGADNPAGA